MSLPDALSPHHALPLVPAPFAEKAMASLMQLHGELMDEKERRVELYRQLMEKEQTVAELRMYVRMLEDRMGLPSSQDPAPFEEPPRRAAAPPKPAQEVAAEQRVHSAPKARPSAPPQPSRPQPQMPPRSAAADGWKAW